MLFYPGKASNSQSIDLFILKRLCQHEHQGIHQNRRLVQSVYYNKMELVINKSMPDYLQINEQDHLFSMEAVRGLKSLSVKHLK